MVLAKMGSSWWDSHRHADRRPALIKRGKIRKAIAMHLESQGFTEVECGALAISPGNEAHLSAFASEIIAPDGARQPVYLHTSPEFACKKLLAAGETKIFDFARVFRNRESGPLHALEFTMLEWYRSQEPYTTVMDDCLDLLWLASETAGIGEFVYQERGCSPSMMPERLTVADALLRFMDIDLFACLTDEGEGIRDALAVAAKDAGLGVADNDSWGDIFSKIMVAIEPHLGTPAPTILYEYPRCEAALARATERDPRLAERFELYVCGVELANGFGELTDPVEQRARFEAEMTEKERIYGERYPIDEDFLAALAEMPPASGVALGFDRLVMLATGSRNLSDVLWTPSL